MWPRPACGKRYCFYGREGGGLPPAIAENLNGLRARAGRVEREAKKKKKKKKQNKPRPLQTPLRGTIHIKKMGRLHSV